MVILTDRHTRATCFIVIDFETVTPAGRRPEPIEVAALALRVQGDQLIPTAPYETLIRPPDDVPVTSADTAQTGITTEMLADAPTAEDALSVLDAKLTDPPYVLVAHNASYEASLIFDRRDHCPQPGPHAPSRHCRLARRVYPHLGNHRLDAVLSHLAIPNPPDRHRAMPDVKATARAFDQLLNDATEDGHWSTLADLTGTAGLTPRSTIVDGEADRPAQQALFG